MTRHHFYKSIILLSALIFMLVGCGREKEENAPVSSESATKTYTINSRMLEFGTEASAMNRNFQIYKDTLYFQSYGREGSSIYCQPILGEGELQRLPLEFSDSEMILSFAPDKYGNIHCFLRGEAEQYILRTYTSQGTVEKEQDITELTLSHQDEFFFTKAVADENGRVCAISESSIWVFEKEGVLAGRVEVPDKDIRDVVSGTDGTVYVTYNLKGKYDIYLAKVDYESGKLCDLFAIPGMGKLYAGSEARSITYDARYLYEIDGTAGEYMAILDLPRHYIKANGICGFSGQGTDEFTFLVDATEGADGFIDSLELITLQEKAVANNIPEEQKTTIRLVAPGTDGEDTHLLNFIMEFNRQSEKYTVTYEPLGLATEQEFALFVNSRLVSEDCPDLLLINYFMYETYAEAGALEDLTPYMAQSSLIKTTDYLETAVVPYQRGNALYGIPKVLNVQGFIGKKSQVKSLYQNMTIDSFLTFLEKNPTAKFEYDGEYCGLLRTCMKFGLDEYVDWENGICYFDGQGFKDLVLRIKNTGNSHAVNRGQWESLLLSDEILFAEVHLSDFYTLEKYAMDYGEELLFLGYPTLDGSLTGEARPEASLGIVANSKNKEGAWEFLKYYLLNYDVPYGMPTEKYSFEKEWMKAKTPVYEDDKNGELIEKPVSQFFYQNGMEPIFAMSEEKAEHIYQVVERAEAVSKDAQALQNIIYEESSAYFYGQKSLEETADIIQNRCQLYLDENR